MRFLASRLLFRTNSYFSSRLSYLFLEVSYCVLVGISEKIQNRVFDMIILEVIHKMRPIALKTQSEHKHKSRWNPLYKSIEQYNNEISTKSAWKYKYLDLLIGGDGTEHDFCEILCGKHSKTNSTNGFVVLDQS